MARHAPLARIAGAPSRPLAEAPEPERFAAAVDYARAMESFALLIWKDGAIVSETYFPPHGPELRPESASMHKSVVGLLVAAAIADGFIPHAGARVGGLITAWEDDPRGDIAIEHLLTMTSGLEPLSSEGGAASAARRFTANGAGARATMLARPLAHPPGARFHYQNAVTQLLVAALEGATGQPYATYLSERLWKRIGAGDAYVWLNEADGFPRGHMALMARARDWLRLGLVVKDRGAFGGERIIPAALMDAALAPSPANVNYGWQIWRGGAYAPRRYYNDDKTGFAVPASAPFAADDIVYFDGFGGQRVYVSRSADLVIVRLGEARADWDDALLVNLALREGA